MGTLLLVAALVALVVFLTRQWPSADPAPALGTPEAQPANVASLDPAEIVRKLDGWPRQLLILLASTTLAYLIASRAFAAWLAIATKAGAAIGIGPGWVTILMAAAVAAIVYRLKNRADATSPSVSEIPPNQPAQPSELPFAAESPSAAETPSTTALPKADETEGSIEKRELP